MAHKLQLRDFIYLDVERLKSLLSQLDRGVVTEVEESIGRKVEGSGSSEAGIAGIVKIGGKGGYLWESTQSETRTLHDHIYSVLEDQLLKDELAADFRDGSPESTSAALDALHPGSLVLVRGRVTVNDWDRMRSILRNFKKISQAVGRLAQTPTTGSNTRGGQDLSSGITGSTLKDMEVVFEHLYTGRNIVLKMPAPDRSRRFVATLEDEWLRERLEVLTFKHSTAPQYPWTMLATVAAVPENEGGVDELAAQQSSSDIESAIDSMFAGLRGFERMGISVVHPDIAVTPISLYVT